MCRMPNIRIPAHRHAGFSLLELMVVLALVGLIMAAIVASIRRRTNEAQKQVARMQVRDLVGMAEQYRLANSGECPSIERWIEDRTLKTPPKDPWGNVLLVRCPGEHEQGSADVISLGPDGQAGTNDDIESWKLQ